MKHGDYSNYTHGGCRCDECRAENSRRSAQDYERNREARLEAQRQYRERMRQRVQAGDPTLPHGSEATYRAGCQCPPCLAEGRRASRERTQAWRDRQAGRS